MPINQTLELRKSNEFGFIGYMRQLESVSPLGRALLLDRDGVINKEKGYVHDRTNFEFIDGIFELGVIAKKHGYKIVVITNQAGIARGFYSEADFLKLTEWMLQQFEAEGISIDKVYYSPFHPTAGIGRYKKDHASRKPRPGMILRAKHELRLDLSNSILVGDKVSDIEAGIAAGVGCNILLASAIPFAYSSRAGVFSVEQLAAVRPFLKPVSALPRQ